MLNILQSVLFSNNLVALIILIALVILIVKVSNKIIRKISSTVFCIYTILKIATMLGINVNILTLFS